MQTGRDSGQPCAMLQMCEEGPSSSTFMHAAEDRRRPDKIDDREILGPRTNIVPLKDAGKEAPGTRE